MTANTRQALAKPIALFSQSLSILEEVKSDRVQFLIRCSVQGKEEEVLKAMHRTAAFVQSCLPENWQLIGYGPCSPRYKTAIGGEGVDLVIHRKYSRGGTITRFQILSDLSLRKIGDRND